MIQLDQPVTERSSGTESTEEATNPDWRVRRGFPVAPKLSPGRQVGIKFSLMGGIRSGVGRSEFLSEKKYG